MHKVLGQNQTLHIQDNKEKGTEGKQKWLRPQAIPRFQALRAKQKREA